MKLTVLLILLINLAVSAGSLGQTKISLQVKNATLEQTLHQIHKVSGFYIFYNQEDVRGYRGLINLDVMDASIDEVLKICTKNTNLNYTINDSTVVVSYRKVTQNQPRTIVISGTVSDEQGQTIPGATVKIKGKDKGVSTDSEGKYTIEVEAKDSLTFSFLGYIPVTECVVGRAIIDIVLKTDVKTLDAVVVTGFQTISKERATGSYTVIGKESLDKPTVDLASQLIGSSSGLQATIDYNGDVTGFTIRGQSSMGGFSGTDNSPLVVVDGFPVQGNFKSINPNDVKSVYVLKDAASASIWGARAANGVIVVTTKNAQKGTPLSVEVSSFLRIGSNLDVDYYLNRASSSATIDFEQYAFTKWGEQIIEESPNYYNFTDKRTAAVVAMNEYRLGNITMQERDDELNRLRKLNNKSQIKKYMLQRPVSQQYNVLLSGSTARMSNTVSLMYSNSRTPIQGNYSDEYMLNYRTSAALAKWLDFDASTMIQYTENQTGGYTRYEIQNLAPYEMLVNSDGSYNNIGANYYYPLIDRYVPKESFPYSDWSYNPIQEMKNRSILSKNLNARVQLGFTFKLFDGLSFSSKGQYEMYNTNTRDFEGEKTFYVRSRVNEASTWDMATGDVVANLPKGAMVKDYRYETRNYNFRNQLDFNRTFNDLHEITFLAGTEVSQSRYKSFDYPISYGFNTDTYSASELPNGTGYSSPLYNWVGWTETFSTSAYYQYSTTRNVSFYGNASYTYNGRYNISASYRTDASNFISDKAKYRYSPFWSVGASWTISDEPFMAENKWIDRLALRATYGYSGNSTSNASFKPTVLVGNRDARTGDYEVTIASTGNPTLRWEKTGTTNIGIDYSFFSGKLYGNVDLYNKHGKDILASVSIPAVNGGTEQSMNNAEILNRGIELTIGTSQSIGKDVVWNGSVNFSYNKNEVKKLFVASYSPISLVSGYAVEGKDASTLWVYRYGGVQNLGTETSPDMQPVILGPNGTMFSLGESTYSMNGLEMMKDAGSKIPPYTLGLTNSFSYKNFNLSFVVTGLFGHKFLTTGFNYPQTYGRGIPNSKLSEVFANGAPLRGINAIELPCDDNDFYYGYWNTNYMDYQVRDAWSIRMQNVTLSYNLPENIMSKLNLSSVTAYVEVNNVFVLKATKEDPDFPLGTEKYLPNYAFGVRVGL
ncbi:MAG: SusC/RagA family TonB-linked outer membrane protein [Bacteroidales bacterium]